MRSACRLQQEVEANYGLEGKQQHSHCVRFISSAAKNTNFLKIQGFGFDKKSWKKKHEEVLTLVQRSLIEESKIGVNGVDPSS